MAKKKGGLEGFSYSDLKQLPQEGFSGLAWLCNWVEQIQQTRRRPRQALWALAYFLPRTWIAEIPIDLLPIRSGVWYHVFQHMFTRWQKVGRC